MVVGRSRKHRSELAVVEVVMEYSALIFSIEDKSGMRVDTNQYEMSPLVVRLGVK